MRTESQKAKVLGLSVGAILLATSMLARADDTSAAPTAPPSPVPAPAAEPAKSWSVDAGADYFSEYLFRGVVLLHDNPIGAPHVYAKWNGFGIYYNGYYGASGRNGGPSFWYEEQDWSADYTHTLGTDKLTGTVGVYSYTYTDAKDGKDTAEVYGILAYNWDVLNPKVQINWDVDAFHTGYGTVGISHTFDVSKCLKLNDPLALTIIPSAQLGIDFGYNSRATQANANWDDALFGLLVNLQVTKYIAVHTGVQFSVAMNSLNDIHQGNAVVGNVGFNVVF